jgi:guanylate kinase
MIFIISGPSGVGKGTVISQLLTQHSTLSLAVSATTRAPRSNEIDGKDYYFLSNDAFQTHISNNDFLEYCEVHQNFYGTLVSEVDNKRSTSSAVIIEIDVQGAQKIKQHVHLPQCHIFITPPSLDILAQRLQKRGTDTPQTIAKRLDKATQEMAHQQAYDFTVTNNELTQTVIELDNIISNWIDLRSH